MAGICLRAVARFVLAAAALLLVSSQAALASPTPGRLFSDGCLANIGTTECDAAGGTTHGQAPGLGNPAGTAVSPDGRYVYVASQGSSTLAVFRRNLRTGALTSDGCVADFGSNTCDAVAGSTHSRARGLAQPVSVAVSHDGRYVYVLAQGTSTIAVLKRDASTGALSSDGCLQNYGSTGCDTAGTTHGQARALTDPLDLAVSPDDAYVYVADYGNSAVAVLKRNSTTGALSGDGCLQESGMTGCDGTGQSTSGEAPGLTHAESVTVSADGHQVYVAGGDAVVVLRRTGSGALVSNGCLGDVAFGTECATAAGTTHSVTPQVRDLIGVAVSPDGRYVYGAARSTSALIVLARNPSSGALLPDGCLSSDAGRCTTGTTQGIAYLNGANRVRVSPDNTYVYVAAYYGSAVTVLKRNPTTGAVVSDGCLQESGGTNCNSGPGATRGQAPGLSGAQDLALAPNGRNVYVASAFSNAVAVFHRYIPTPVLSGLRLRPASFRVGKGTKVQFRLSTAAAVRFTVQRVLTGRRAGKRCVAVNHRNRSRKHCRRFVTLAGSLLRTGRAGRNSFKFSGRWHGRKLKPGSYRLVALPVALGIVGRQVSAGFKVRKH